MGRQTCIAEPGRQVLITADAGRTEELPVAQERRLPAGTELDAYGPSFGGYRHVWAIRPHRGTLTFSRGVLPLLLTVAVVIPMVVVGIAAVAL
ncbi:hypothetical protein [Gordonia aquimaris]|uniref:Uncharacterized protein n=1 Tax=Gordonia aquimaris TaxID=2984863 RepID=A0A9X3I712_9ACTN|nr:hypothetical protein [Gordonia aquimaris]MCX2966851.1 hypothetical protein [Gordonia aquimaris]